MTFLSTAPEWLQTGLTSIGNYLKDDWGDNALSSRSSTSDGVFAHPDANEAGDTLIGRYRPEWNVDSGSVSASSGAMQVPAGDATVQMAETPSQFTTGTWKIDFTADSTPSSGSANVVWFGVDDTYTSSGNPNNSYHTLLTSDGGANFNKEDAGTETALINGTWGADTATYTFKATRDAYGNFEHFVDGTSQGTATDTTFTDCSYFFTVTNFNVAYNLDNLVVN